MTFFCGKLLSSHPEILPSESLAKLPIRWHNVPWSGSPTVTGCDSEREWLTNQDRVWLPVLTPVTTHGHPTSLWPFQAHLHDIPCTRDVGDQNQVEVTETVDCESDSTLLSTRHTVQTKKYTKGVNVISHKRKLCKRVTRFFVGLVKSKPWTTFRLIDGRDYFNGREARGAHWILGLLLLLFTVWWGRYKHVGQNWRCEQWMDGADFTD